MYKNAGKFAQRFLEKTGSRVNAVAPARKSKKRLKAEAEAAQRIPKTNRHSDKLIGCPDCDQKLQRVSLAIQKHFLESHGQHITEAEAYRIASPGRKGKSHSSYKSLPKIPGQVSGGLPSLGKRR